MCGIAGFIDTSASSTPEWLKSTTTSMIDAISHRGPDDAQVWVDSTFGVGLGFRRLAILDLSPAGRQPMQSACGRYLTVFNGEIYNYKDLKKEVVQAGFSSAFRGTSDTEVLLAGFTQWGIEATLKKTNGMFDIAVWDTELKRLTLSRDRMGEKPLHYGWIGKYFVFGSELKSFKQVPGFTGELNHEALALYFRHLCIPAPYTAYQGIWKLPPATYIELEAKTKELSEPKEYWSLRDTIEDSLQDPYSGSFYEASKDLESLLLDAVGIRMVADVPLGAFLSGGIDSSTIVALMQAQSSKPVKTFSIGFNEDLYNEAEHAMAVAKHLKTDHTELYVSPEESRNVIPMLPEMYDEPFADSSQIPTYLVAKLARQKVTVSLSGDGGDELFGGYNRYVWGRMAWDRFGGFPVTARKSAALLLGALPPSAWNRSLHLMDAFVPSRWRFSNPGEKIQKLSQVLPLKNPEEIYVALSSQFNPPSQIFLKGKEAPTRITEKNTWPRIPDPTDRMMFLDQVTYLPDDILTKVDRATMAVSLEGRIPFLDPRVIALAWRFPLSWKIHQSKTKCILRDVLYRYVPQALIDRPKMGFSVPIDSWIRGPLKKWAEDLIEPSLLKKQGFLNPALVQKLWSEHQSEKRNRQHQLWTILCFQSWLNSK